MMTERQATEPPSDVPWEEDWVVDGKGLEAEPGSAWAFTSITECRSALGYLGEHLDKVVTVEHQVPIGNHRTLHVREAFSLSSWLQKPRKAVLLLPGSVHQSSVWSIPVPGYNGMEMVAQRGMFAFTVDYLGVGESYRPESGLDATVEANVAAIREVVRHVRFFRGVPRVDLVGEGYGGIIASQLAGDSRRTRSCAMIAIPYRKLAGGPATSPEVLEHLSKAPNGYLTRGFNDYDMFFEGTPTAVQEYIRQTQPGQYPTPFTTLVLGEPPFFDPSVARAPGLLLCGEKDWVIAPEDPPELAAAYGREGARLAVSKEAGHAPRIESPAVAEWLWNEIFSFIEEASGV